MLNSISPLNSGSAIILSFFVAKIYKDQTVPESVKDVLFILKNYGFEAIVDKNLRESLEFLDTQRIIHFHWNYCNLFCLQPDGYFMSTQKGVHNPDGTNYEGVNEYYGTEDNAGWDFYEPWPWLEEDDRPNWFIAAELCSKISFLVSVAGNDIFTVPKMQKALHLFKVEVGQYGNYLSGNAYNNWIV